MKYFNLLTTLISDISIELSDDVKGQGDIMCLEECGTREITLVRNNKLVSK